MSEGKPLPRRSIEDQAVWHTVCEILEAGQYEQVAEILGKAAEESERGGDASSAQILAAARRICLACGQSLTEAEWHQQAYQEAEQRKRDLEQQLRALLDLTGGHEMIDSHSVPMPEPSSLGGSPSKSLKHTSLWQRIQGLMGQSPTTRAVQDEPTAISDKAPARPSLDRTEMSATLSVREEKGYVSPSLAFYCLGSFRVYQNDKVITAWNGLKGQCVLKYLVAHHAKPITKDILMEVFWPDADPDAARRNLHQAVYSLRQTLRQEQPDFQHIQFENDCYLLNPELDIWLDFKEFENHVQAGRRLEATGQLAEAMAEYGIAEGLYQGDFLEEDLYQDWPSWQREHIRDMYLDIVDRLSEYYVQQGEYTAAIALCQKALAQDNCYEQAHRRLMHCYLGQGQRHLAVRQYQTCVEALREELDLTPSEEIVALYRRIITTA